MTINEKILEEFRDYCKKAADIELDQMSDGLFNIFCFLVDFCNNHRKDDYSISFPKKLKNIVVELKLEVTNEFYQRYEKRKKGS